MTVIINKQFYYVSRVYFKKTKVSREASTIIYGNITHTIPCQIISVNIHKFKETETSFHYAVCSL
jgi:hypothetical protein